VPGGVAQLGERLLCKQEVIGSIPFTSTILWANVKRKSVSRISVWPLAKSLFRSLTIRKKQSVSVPRLVMSREGTDNGLWLHSSSQQQLRTATWSPDDRASRKAAPL
jgi:hypothetical protein